MKNKYNLLLKTGDAEIRALEKSQFDTSKIFPIIELTRGRKSKYDQVGLISKRIERLSKIFSNQSICIDLTTSEELSNSQIEELYTSVDGYSNWINFLTNLNDKEYFKEIVPTILVDTEDETLEENLLKQVKSLTKTFSKIAYRNNILDDGYYDDIEVFAEYINKKKKNDFIFILDCEYVPSGATRNIAELAKARIKKVKSLIPNTKVIIVSTSFPRYVSDIGNDNYDIFPILEINIFNDIKEAYSDVLYGDYGSINPIRNDTVIMARGWIPRIDVPTLEGIYYYRVRNTLKDYAATYSLVAEKVYRDSKFPIYQGNWGIKQIISAKAGKSPGSAPSFWISVRMSIFIAMQLKRLGQD